MRYKRTNMLDSVSDTLATMRTAAFNINMERLIYSKNPDPAMGKNEIKKTTWRLRMLFKSFPLREPSHGTAGRNTYRPTAEEVNQWAQSLDNLLNSKYGMTAFRLFMKSEFCEENIEFWLACEEFQKISSKSKLRSRAKRIYEEFVEAGSSKEVNLDFNTKEKVDQCLLFPTQSAFKAAQDRVYYLMEHNSYPRFLESELYRQLRELAVAEQ